MAASEDAPVLSVPPQVEPDAVARQIHAATSALEETDAELRHWPEHDRELFRKQVASKQQEYERCSLTDINLKISRLADQKAKAPHEKVSVRDGTLSLGAKLHASLIALRQCQAVASRKAHETKLSPGDWLTNARQNQQEASLGMPSANGNAKKQPASGGASQPYGLPPRTAKSRGQQQAAAATGKAPLALTPSARGGRGFLDSVDNYQGRGGNFRSNGGGPPGVTSKQMEAFACGAGTSGGGGDRAAAKVPFGSAAPGRAKSAAAAQPPARATRQKSGQKCCERCKFLFPIGDVNESPSLKMSVCKECELLLHDSAPKNAFHSALEAAQRPPPKAKKSTEPVHITLLTDDEAEPDAEDKPVAEAVRKRPERAAAIAGQSLSQQLAGLKALYPPSNDTHAVEVSASDLFHLQPSEFLNDTVIDLYLKKLERELSEPLSKRVHFFNTFFYKKLSQKTAGKPEAAGKAEAAPSGPVDRFTPPDRASHDRVKKWTKHVDIFSKDFVFVPVHAGLHWSLVIICHPGVLPPATDHEIIDIDGGPASAPLQAAGSEPALPVTQEDAPAAASRAPGEPSDMDLDAAKPAAEDVSAMLAAAAEPPPAPPPVPAPFILHLDSMSGGHSPAPISGKLRPYLAMEWERLALNNPESVPARSGIRNRSFAKEVLTFRKLTLPQQNNSSDCGCFLLTYIEHFLKCVPDCLSFEQLNSLEKGKGISLPDCADFLGEHWFDPVRGFNMREQLTNVILDLFVAQAAEPQDDAARARLEKAKAALASGRANEAREAEAAKAKELKYAEKLRRRAERLAAGPQAAPEVLGVASDSDSELPPGPTSRTRAKKSGAAANAAAAADDDAEPRRSSGRVRRSTRTAAADADFELAQASGDDDFEEPAPKAKKKRRKYRLVSVEDTDDEAEMDVRPTNTRREAKAGASAPPPADAIDMDAYDDQPDEQPPGFAEPAPGFVTAVVTDAEGAPGFPPPQLESFAYAAPPAASADAWGQSVPVRSHHFPEPFPPMVPSLPPPQDLQPLKVPQLPVYSRRRKSAPAAPEQHAAAAEVIDMGDDDDDAKKPADDSDDGGTQSL